MWCKLNPRCSRRRAIIKLGKQLNFLDDLSYQWLLREAGETHGPRDGNRPVWNPKRGEFISAANSSAKFGSSSGPPLYKLI